MSLSSAIVCTFFARSAMPTNLLTVPEWRQFEKAARQWVRDARPIQSGRTIWERAALSWANVNGGAHVLLADDTLVVYTKRESRVERRSYKRGSWAWDQEGAK